MQKLSTEKSVDKIQQSLNELHDKRFKVSLALGKLRDKAKDDSKSIEKLLYLTKNKLRVRQEDNVLQEEVPEQPDTHQPLYRQVYPEWGGLDTKFKAETALLKHEAQKEKKKQDPLKTYPLCMQYFKYKTTPLIVFALVSEVSIYLIHTGNKK